MLTKWLCLLNMDDSLLIPLLVPSLSLTGCIVLDQFEEKEMGSMHCVKAWRNASDTVPSDKLEKEQMYQGGVLPNYELTQLVAKFSEQFVCW